MMRRIRGFRQPVDQRALLALKDLKINVLNLEDKGWVEGDGVLRLAEVLKVNDTLTTLNLRQNHIGDSGAEALAGLLLTKTALQELSLGFNAIGFKGAVALSKALAANKVLLSLDLRGNHIGTGPEGPEVIGAALRENSHLTMLDLSRNHIGDYGVSHLAEALEQNSTLLTLSLNGNRISWEGALCLGKALKTNSALKTLHLFDNQIGNHGAQVISQALEHNSTLERLFVAGNHVRLYGLSAIARALQVNMVLNSIDVDVIEKELRPEAESTIAKVLQNVRSALKRNRHPPLVLSLDGDDIDSNIAVTCRTISGREVAKLILSWGTSARDLKDRILQCLDPCLEASSRNVRFVLPSSKLLLDSEGGMTIAEALLM